MDKCKFHDKYSPYLRPMDGQTLELLTQAGVKEVIETHLNQDPSQFALRANPEWPVTAIATQLGLLQKAKLKLPAWYAARCLFTPRAFAQATNQGVLPTRALQPGKLAIDLTSGLGVDAVHLSEFFDQVVYNDADLQLCALAKVNFERLGRKNITVSNEKAGELLASQESESVDLLFIDPDRRDAKGQRKAAFSDCQPDVLQLMPAMLAALKPEGCLMIKASPMLDVEEGRRQLLEVAPWVGVQVISLDNEVKEVLFRVTKSEVGNNPPLRLDWNRKGRLGHFIPPKDAQDPSPSSLIQPIPLDPHPQYLFEPDVAFYKGRVTLAYAQQWLEKGLSVNHPEGYYFSGDLLSDFPGRTFRIKAIWPYKPKKIKSHLKKAGVGRIEIGRRYFDLGIGKVYQQLGVKPGGQETLLCTKQPDGNRLAVWCERIS